MEGIGGELSGDVREGLYAWLGEGMAESFCRDGVWARRGPVSLDIPIGDGYGSTLGDFVVDGSAEPQPDDVDIEALRERLAKAIDMLPDPERKAMSLRFGREDGAPHTLGEVGSACEMPIGRVRQIEARLLARLRGARHGTRLEDLLDD